MKKAIFGALCAMAIVATTGCTGSFKLTQAVHHWHTGFESRWTNEICYLLSILTVYPCSFAVDTVFLNSMEFWMDGQNPITLSKDQDVITRIDENNATVETLTGNSYTLTRNSNGTLTLTNKITGQSGTANAQGEIIAMN